MRKFLRALTEATVIKIANDLGYEGLDPKVAAEHIIESAKAYRWSVADLSHRYNL